MNKNQLKLVENDHKFCYWWWYKNKNISINCKGFILYKIIIIILYQPTHFLEEIRALNYNLKKNHKEKETLLRKSFNFFLNYLICTDLML